MSPGLQQLYDSLDDKQKAGLNRALRQVSHCGRAGGAHEIAAAMTHFKRSCRGFNPVASRIRDDVCSEMCDIFRQALPG